MFHVLPQTRVRQEQKIPPKCLVFLVIAVKIIDRLANIFEKFLFGINQFEIGRI